MVRGRDEVFDSLARNRSEIRSFGVRRLGLFGSCARGESTAESDLDFLVDLERKTFDDYMGLKLYLEDLFGCDVDLVMTSAIKPALRERILGEAVDVPLLGYPP